MRKISALLADKIVNDVEFKKIENLQTHQSSWKKSVSEIYDQYHFKREWTKEIAEECVKADIEFSTSPYDYDAVDLVDEYLSFYKIGSGDISCSRVRPRKVSLEQSKIANTISIH